MRKIDGSLDLVIFSRDRAAQLDLTLRSIFDHMKGFQSIHILYQHTTDEFAAGYSKLFAHYKPLTDEHKIIAVKEKDFQTDYRRIIAGLKTKYVMNFADDNVVVRPMNTANIEFDSDICAFTTRMSLLITNSYTEGRPSVWKHDPMISDGQLKWNWTRESGEQGYSFCIDFNIYDIEFFRDLLGRIHFRAPNSLEGAMSGQRAMFKPMIKSFVETKVIGVPVNKVQTENGNHAGLTHGLTAAEANSRFLDGQRISTAGLYNLRPRAPHVEVDLKWETP